MSIHLSLMRRVRVVAISALVGWVGFGVSGRPARAGSTVETASAPAAAPAEFESGPPEPIGVGDGKIWLIPSLSAPSVKNGGKLTIQTVIKAPAGVRSVRAEIMDGDRVLDALDLKPGDARTGGVGRLGGTATQPNLALDAMIGPTPAVQTPAGVAAFDSPEPNPSTPDSAPLGLTNVGVWTADWTAHNLAEKFYAVRLTVIDGSDHAFTDASLTFSDPLAGNFGPGTTDDPNGGLRRVGQVAISMEGKLGCCAIDTLHGYAYFGTYSYPGQVVKIALGDMESPMTRVGSLTFNPGEDYPRCAVIDPAAGFAYFGTDTPRGIVVKIALGGDGPPTRVGAVMLNPGENNLRSGVIDPAAGCAYFGTYSAPGRVVKVGLGGAGSPTRLGVLELAPGEDILTSAAIDTAAGYAYFGTETEPGRVVKVALVGDGPPTRVGAVTLDPGENDLWSAVIDPIAGYGYFGTNTNPGIVIKIALGGEEAPSRVAALTLAAESWRPENALASAVIDPAAGYAYFGCTTWPGRIVKIALGGAGPPTVAESMTLQEGQDSLWSAAIDPGRGRAYFGTWTSPGRVVEIGLTGSHGPYYSSITLNTNYTSLDTAAINPGKGFAYFGNSYHGRLITIGLSGDGSPNRSGEALPTVGMGSAVIDTSAGYIYLGSLSSPGYVKKIALGSDGVPAPAGELSLRTDEDRLVTAVIDPASGFAYFGTQPLGHGTFPTDWTWPKPKEVVKVALGGTGSMTESGAIVLGDVPGDFTCSVIDPGAGYAYFGTDYGNLIKLTIHGDGSPTLVGVLPLGYRLDSAVIDPGAGYAYLGSGGRVVKVALGGDGIPVIVGTLDVGEGWLTPAVIDPVAGYAYFGANIYPAKVVKVALGGDGLPTRVGVLELNVGRISSSAIDIQGGYAYFGTTRAYPSSVIKIQLSGAGRAGLLESSKITMPEEGQVLTVSLHSRVPTGNVRLALYGDAGPRNLLWESEPTSNTAENDWLKIPISAGSPSELTLPAGDYQLAWQVDSNADIADMTQGVSVGYSGDGFSLNLPFGPAPKQLNQWNPAVTNRRWSAYVSYAAPSIPTGVLAALLGYAPTSPALDLNSDGAVDIADLVAEP